MKYLPFILAVIMTIGVMALPFSLAAEESPSWGEEPASEEIEPPAELGPSTGSLVLIQSLTTVVGSGVVIFGGGYLMLSAASASPLLMAMITLGLGVATPFVSALTTSVTGSLLGGDHHLGWSTVGALLGLVGGYVLYAIYDGIADQPFNLGLALGTMFAGNVAGSVGGYHLGRHLSKPSERMLSLELLREPNFSEPSSKQINGFMLNWNYRF